MRRREFVTLLGGAAAWPLAARAQQEQMRRIGVLSGFPQTDSVGQSLLTAFRQRLTALGWIEGSNVDIQTRWAGSDSERMRAQAIELVRMIPDVIVVHGSRALTAVRQETDRVPILFASVADPVAAGYVASLAKPGGNITGFTIYVGLPAPKLLETLKEIAPTTIRAALVATPGYPGIARQLQDMESVAPSLVIKPTTMLIRDPAAIEPTIAAFAQEPNCGLVVTTDVFLVTHRALIIAAAARHRLPAIYQDRSFVADGGLISYGVDRAEAYRRVATYVDRIFRGAKPAELPVQQPSKFELVLNLKTAKTLGLTVPRTLLSFADEVIE